MSRATLFPLSSAWRQRDNFYTWCQMWGQPRMAQLSGNVVYVMTSPSCQFHIVANNFSLHPLYDGRLLPNLSQKPWAHCITMRVSSLRNSGSCVNVLFHNLTDGQAIEV
jgi:hypothetical protein